jgi:hypothetical protein
VSVLELGMLELVGFRSLLVKDGGGSCMILGSHKEGSIGVSVVKLICVRKFERREVWGVHSMFEMGDGPKPSEVPR